MPTCFVFVSRLQSFLMKRITIYRQEIVSPAIAYLFIQIKMSP